MGEVGGKYSQSLCSFGRTEKSYLYTRVSCLPWKDGGERDPMEVPLPPALGRILQLAPCGPQSEL